MTDNVSGSLQVTRGKTSTFREPEGSAAFPLRFKVFGSEWQKALGRQDRKELPQGAQRREPKALSVRHLFAAGCASCYNALLHGTYELLVPQKRIC